MPEGDTIFRSARSLGRALCGEVVTAFRSTYPNLTRFHDDTPITGRTVDNVESRGKWLLMHFSGGATLATHMLMSGSWHIYHPGDRWFKPRSSARIVVENSRYLAVGFNVPVAEMHTPESLLRQRRIPATEVDVLSNTFDEEEVKLRLFAKSGETVADALLNQRIFAGVGNVFKSEVCFVTGIHPYCPVADLSPDQVDAIISTSRKLVRANVLEDSGDMIVTYMGRGRRTTHDSDPGTSLWVYGRTGQPCRRCGEPIRRRIQGDDARVTFWCPRCQPMPDGSDVDG